MAAPPGAQEGDYPHADEPIGRVEQIYDGALMPDEAVATFRNIDRLFPTRKVVIVTFGAQPKPVGKEPIDPLVFFDAVAARLD